MKHVRTLSLLALGSFALAGLASCGPKKPADGPAKGMKVGLILLHPAASSTYDKNFKEAFDAAQAKLGFTAVVQTAEETAECRQKAEQMAEDGCAVVFADSFGHEPYIMEAAANYPNTLFCHATGVQAATSGLQNFFNAFASIYEGRYLAGVAAGLKLKAMYGEGEDKTVSAANAKLGYIGAYTYAEVVSGYTSFYLGVKSVVPAATMDVQFTGSWYNENEEKTAAQLLINNGAKLISQHADSYGAPNACEEANIPNVSYNGSTLSQCPNTFLVSSKINWAPYYEHVIMCALNGTKPNKNYTGTFATDSVQLTEFSPNCAEGTAAYVESVKQELLNGQRHVFDTSTFKIGGATPTEENCRPGSSTWSNIPAGTNFISGGYYHESEYRSAPSFDVEIDGITLLNRKY